MRAHKYLVSIKSEYWSVSGQLKLWKRDPFRFRLPIRRGGCFSRGNYVTPENVEEFHFASECPLWGAYYLMREETGSDEPEEGEAE